MVASLVFLLFFVPSKEMRMRYVTGKAVKFFAIFAVTLCLFACARNPAADPRDPYESYNRKVYNFNTIVDKSLFRPIAKGYNFITPDFVRGRVSNAFNNLSELSTIGNDILQGKVGFMIMDLWRVIINTTIGLGGMFDPAARFGFAPHNEDFGLTLAAWGAKDSTYSVAPFLGPSTFRDTFGSVVDVVGENFAVWNFIKPYWLRWGLYGLDLVNIRTNLLDADSLVDSSFDPYIFVRDAYLQRRKQQILDNEISAVSYYNQYYHHSLPGDQASNRCLKPLFDKFCTNYG